MIRIALGLLCGIALALLELDGDLALAGESTRITVWIVFSVAFFGLLLSGLRALAAEVRETRAYGAARRGRFALTPPAWSAIRLALLGALASLVFAAQVEVEERRADWPPKAEVLALPRQDVLKVLSLGYREFAADLIWIRSISYFGEHLNSDRKYHWLERYLDTVVYLDPLFRTVYRYAGTVTMYNLKAITRKAIETSNRYLEAGYRHFPDDWQFPFTICSNYLFELPRFAVDAAEKRRFRETGVQYCREASVLPGAMSYLSSVVGSVLSRLGKRQLARRHYRELILRTEDPKVRAHLERSYAALESAETAKGIKDEASAFFRRHRASYPYATPDLFFLLGPRGEFPDGVAAVQAGLEKRRAAKP